MALTTANFLQEQKVYPQKYDVERFIHSLPCEHPTVTNGLFRRDWGEWSDEGLEQERRQNGFAL